MSVGPGELLLRTIVLVALLVGGIVAIAETHAVWTLALAVTGLVLAAGAMAASVGAMLGRTADARPSAPSRARVGALAALAIVALALAVALPDDRAAADSTARPTAAAAAQTVRDFLAAGVLENDAYAACQYLTPAAQDAVARAAGDGQTCRDALTASPPSFAAIPSEGSLHTLAVRAVLTGPSTADATIARPGRPPVAVVLRRATAAEQAAFAAPQGAWRIASTRPSL